MQHTEKYSGALKWVTSFSSAQRQENALSIAKRHLCLELHPTAIARECHEHCPIAEQLTKSEQHPGTMMARRN